MDSRLYFIQSKAIYRTTFLQARAIFDRVKIDFKFVPVLSNLLPVAMEYKNYIKNS